MIFSGREEPLIQGKTECLPVERYSLRRYHSFFHHRLRIRNSLSTPAFDEPCHRHLIFYRIMDAFEWTQRNAKCLVISPITLSTRSGFEASQQTRDSRKRYRLSWKALNINCYSALDTKTSLGCIALRTMSYHHRISLDIMKTFLLKYGRGEPCE